MGRARDISKVFSTSTSLATDSEVSGSYLTQASASTTYQTKATNGLVLLNTTSFSAVSNQVISNIFSATYDDYLIVVSELIGSTTATLDFKLRTSTTDASTSYYWGLALTNSLASSFPAGGSNVSSFRITNIVSAIRGLSVFTVSSPFLAKETLFAGSVFGEFAGNLVGGGSGGLHAVATSYESFNIIASSGTVTGKVKVYGYNK